VPPAMEWLFVVVPFVVVGVIVIFYAFSGGGDAARRAYSTRRGRFFIWSMVGLYAVLGVAVPALVIADRGEAEGGTGSLRSKQISGQLEEGKQTFIQTCKSCHTLEAVNAHGVTGPNLDDLAPLDKQRVLNAIERGGTGTGRMPPQLLDGADAEAVATYVADVAGR
jgi:mono/diheme cytochrome c family protein